MNDVAIAETVALTADVALAKATRGELLDSSDLRAIWGIGYSQYHRLLRAGAFDAFKVHPAIGSKQFSGVLVARYVRGESVLPVSPFGRKRGSR